MIGAEGKCLTSWRDRRPLPPHKLPIRHPVRLIGIRPLPLLQIFYIGLEIPLELRAPKRGYDVVGTRFIAAIVSGGVVHICHKRTLVTMPLVTAPAIRWAATIGASANWLIRIDRVPPELGSDPVNHFNDSVAQPVAFDQLAGRGPLHCKQAAERLFEI